MNKFIAGLAIVAAPVSGASQCGVNEPVHHEVVSIHQPWVEDGPGGTVPNGCAGDGRTFAIVYKTSKGGAWVTVKDPQGKDTPILYTDCVLADKTKGLAPGSRYNK